MNVGVGKLVAPSYSRDIVTVSNDLQFASRVGVSGLGFREGQSGCCVITASL